LCYNKLQICKATLYPWNLQRNLDSTEQQFEGTMAVKVTWQRYMYWFEFCAFQNTEHRCLPWHKCLAIIITIIISLSSSETHLAHTMPVKLIFHVSVSIP
jgi:hypothetical protein